MYDSQKMKRLQGRIKEWRINPCRFVWDAFQVEPDRWQEKALMLLASKDGRADRISLQAAVGPGKSTVLAWAAHWFLACQGEKGEHPKGAAVSITKENLDDNLWTEISKWLERSKYMKEHFEWQSNSFFNKDHPTTWYMSARSWSRTATTEEQGRTLSGLHSKYVFCLIDEAGDIPPSVLRSAEQALSNCTWGKIMMAGNPTSTSGCLYLAYATLAHQWTVIKITGDPEDPDRAPRIDMEWAKQQIEQYGRSNPWVMSAILGQYPTAAMNSLLSAEDVRLAMSRDVPIESYQFSQKRLGVDVALYGADRTVLFPRQGLASFQPIVLRTQEPADIGARILYESTEFGQEMEFIDCGGGYGSGVVSYLKQAGRAPVQCFSSAKAMEENRFFNKRAEMWWKMCEWVKGGGSLPQCQEIVAELTEPTYTLKGGKFLIEPKELVKKRIGRSPDIADSLALSFYLPDQPGKAAYKRMQRPHKPVDADYNPIADDRFD